MNASFPVSSTVSLRDALVAARHDRVFHGILLMFLALTLAWNFITPVFEAPDEPAHLQYILFVADRGRPPNLLSEVQLAGTASFESPLYYLVLGNILRASGLPHPFIYPQRNPDFSWARNDGPLNYFIPANGSYGYVHFLRGFSSLFGLGTVLCSYLAAVLMGANQRQRWATAAVTGFLPQFVFISGVINNDTLATLLASIGFVLLLQLIHSGPGHTYQAMVWGAVCALALLTKPHTLYLLLFGVFLIMPLYWRRWNQLLGTLMPAGLGFCVIAGWYLVANQLHYGDPLLLRMQTRIVADQVTPRSLLNVADGVYLVLFLPYLLFQSFLGIFGWMIVYLPTWLYLIFGILWLGALIGAATALVKRRWNLVRRSLILAPAILFGIIFYANLTYSSNQGRYFFPALLPISLLFVFGLAELPTAWRRLSLAAAPLFLLGTSLFSLWLVWNSFAR
jgi:hypothetical protein